MASDPHGESPQQLHLHAACDTACGRADSTSARILVDRPDVMIDMPLSIRLDGFAAHCSITVAATLHALDGTTWQSSAVYTSDAHGRVDLSTAAPESGSYDGVSAMGLFWSMQRIAGEPTPLAPDSILQPRRVDLQASATADMHAQASLVRWAARPGVTRHVVRDSGLVGTLFLPPGGSKRAAVLVLGGSGGVAPEPVAALLASHGYAALALSYFRQPGLPQVLSHIRLEYFEHAIGWMRAQDWLRDGFLAVLGNSRGGELALLLGATNADINAVVAYTPSGLVHCGLDPTLPDNAPAPPAWTYRGTPIPYLEQNNLAADERALAWRGNAMVTAPLFTACMRDAQAVRRSTIAVERIAGPVLMISGKDDAMWPAFELAEIARARLEAHRHPFAFMHLAYEGAGHSISVPYLATTMGITTLHPVTKARYALGGSPQANAHAAADSWPKVLGFLEQARARVG